MRRATALGILLVVLGSPAWAEVTVSIVDHPAWVLRYSPVFLTARVSNQGSEPVLVPADRYSSNCYFAESARHGQPLEERQRFDAVSGPDRVVWLEPGESWLFRVDLQPWLVEPGTYQARVGLRGNGECILQPTGSEVYPLTPVPHEGRLQRYQCWEGEIRSEIVSIEVVEPDTATDREALAFVKSPEYPLNMGYRSERDMVLRLQLGYQFLRERFPASHYTYVGGFYRSKSAKTFQELTTLQPNHPLSPYARLEWALAVVRSAQHDEGVPFSISDLDLPSGLREYLAQEMRALE